MKNLKNVEHKKNQFSNFFGILLFAFFCAVNFALSFLIFYGFKFAFFFQAGILVIFFVAFLIFKKRKPRNFPNEFFLDDLTSLPNRKKCFSLLESMFSENGFCPIFSIVLFDFDNFRMLNDFLGYRVGDNFILEVAQKIAEQIHAPDVICKIGGDEFLVILRGAKTDEELEAFTAKLRGILNLPFYYKDHEYNVTASFGISRCPKDSQNAIQLFQQAELALYRAKVQGKNRVAFFDEEMQNALESRVRFSRELQNAIARNELFVEFQPVYAVRTKELRGFEVLARWSSRQLGNVAPSDFIPLAEENGSIVEIGRWIFECACEQYVALYSDAQKKPILAVNISVVQLRDPQFIENVEKIILRTKIDPNFLEFEVTESVCINSPTMVKHLLSELKRLGIRISLDDFGTGYSSLSYLRTLPFDIVKIDKSFIDTIGIVPDAKNIVKTIVGMAHQLDLKVIAEGVERAEQFDYLLNCDCDFIQGNFLGKPIAAEGL